MAKLDGLVATLHLERQLIIAAACTIAGTLWVAIQNSEFGWPLISGATLVIVISLLLIAKKSMKIKVLLQEIADC